MSLASFKAVAEADFERLSAHMPVKELHCKTILLTGATGFFGTWLLSLFGWLNSARQARLTVLAVSRDPASFLTRHPGFENTPWLVWIKGDVRSFPAPSTPVDYVIHAATDTSAEAGKTPSLLLDTIVEGTRHVLDYARQCGARRVLLISSGAVYGAQSPDVTHMDENTSSAPSPLQIGHAYGVGKRVMELLGAIYARETDAQVVIARCFAFVGAGLPLNAHFAIGNFIRDALGAEKIAVRGGGTAERSYLYAADLAIWLARLLVSGKSGEAYNVGSDQALTIGDLARTVAKLLASGKEVVIEGKDDPSRGRNRYIPSIAKARSDCQLDVWTGLDQAILLTASYKP
jgi:dTDP-glucose 4,6-dehydratase